MGYLLPFEIVSVHLLVVLIGAAYLARAKRGAEPPEDLMSATSFLLLAEAAVEGPCRQPQPAPLP